MSKKICFIGHRTVSICQHVEEKLRIAIQKEIDFGCRCFMMGTHGDFDKMVLNICREFRKIYKDIEIEVVITSLNEIKREEIKDEIYGNEIITPYEDVKTIMFEIEEVYFKRRIISSNRQMIDTCDTLICFVDETRYRSGAEIAMKYAKKSGLKIINLYREEDETTYGMTEEQKKEY